MQTPQEMYITQQGTSERTRRTTEPTGYSPDGEINNYRNSGEMYNVEGIAYPGEPRMRWQCNEGGYEIIGNKSSSILGSKPLKSKLVEYQEENKDSEQEEEFPQRPEGFKGILYDAIMAKPMDPAIKTIKLRRLLLHQSVVSVLVTALVGVLVTILTKNISSKK